MPIDDYGMFELMRIVSTDSLGVKMKNTGSELSDKKVSGLNSAFRKRANTDFLSCPARQDAGIAKFVIERETLSF